MIVSADKPHRNQKELGLPPPPEIPTTDTHLNEVLNILNDISFGYDGKSWESRKSTLKLGIKSLLPGLWVTKDALRDKRYDDRLWSLEPGSTGIEAVVTEEGPEGLIGPNGEYGFHAVLANGWGGYEDGFEQVSLLVTSFLGAAAELSQNANGLKAVYDNALINGVSVPEYVDVGQVGDLVNKAKSVTVRILIEREGENESFGFVDVPLVEFTTLVGKPMDQWMKERMSLRWQGMDKWYVDQHDVPIAVIGIGEEAKNVVDLRKDPRIPFRLGAKQDDQTGNWETSFIFQHGFLGNPVAKEIVQRVQRRLQDGMKDTTIDSVVDGYTGRAKINAIEKSDLPIWLEANPGLREFVESINLDEWFGPVTLVDKVPQVLLDRLSEMYREDISRVKSGFTNRVSTPVRMLAFAMMGVTERANMMSVEHIDSKTKKVTLGMVTTGVNLIESILKMEGMKIQVEGNINQETIKFEEPDYIKMIMGSWLLDKNVLPEWVNSLSSLKRSIDLAKDFGVATVTYLAQMVGMARKEGELAGNIIAKYVSLVAAGGLGHISDLKEWPKDLKRIVLKLHFDSGGSKFVKNTWGMLIDSNGDTIMTAKDLLGDPTEMLAFSITPFQNAT